MATATPIPMAGEGKEQLMKDDTKCPACLEVFEDPYVLDCLHSYCKKCMTRMEKKNKIHCNLCQTVTDVSNIKPDYILQTIIGINDVDKQSHGPYYLKKCGLCDATDGTITHHCTVCENFLCSLCVQNHKTSMALKAHKLVVISRMVKNFESKCRSTANELEKEAANIDKHLTSIHASIKDIEEANENQVDELHRLTQEGIRALEKNEKLIANIVHEANDNVLNYLKENKLNMEQQQKDLQSKASFLKYLIESKDVGTLHVAVKGVNETIKEDLKTLSDKLLQVKTDVKSPVSLEKNRDWDVKDSIELTVGVTKGSGYVKSKQEPEPNYGNSTFSELCRTNYQHCQVVSLEFQPRRLHMIDKQLWCTGPGGVVNVYNKKGQTVKEIRYPMISKANSVVMTDTGAVIIACLEGQGLHTLNQKWQYGKHIANGSFSDIDLYEGDIYALDYKKCKIVVLRQDDKKIKWNKIQQFNLQHEGNGSEFDTLVVHSSGIYVSSAQNNCIYLYSTDGHFKYQTGEKGQIRPGQFSRPVLCDVDPNGCMLVADCNNHRVQVCDVDGSWYVVSLPDKDMKNPIDAVLGDEGELWIIGNHVFPNMLQKYTC